MAELLALAELAAHPDQVGPKLRRLAELAARGVRVPDGFALTRHAIDAIAAREPGARWPAALSDAIARELDALATRIGRPDPLLAVRSAALAEDGDERSFAGMYETVLGVRGQRAVEDAIDACVAARHSERADSYADGVVMTVGVQELIGARAAGVLFTRHPITHRDDRLVIECVHGLGQTMVDGDAHPDHIEIGRTDTRVLDYTVGDKQRRAVAIASGVAIEDTPPELRHAPCLELPEIEALCRIALDVEAGVGRAIDLEWVVTGDGEPVVVQVRPITSGPARARAPLAWNPLAYLPGGRGER